MIGAMFTAFMRFSQLKKLLENPKVKAAVEKLKVEYYDLPKELRILAGVLLLALLGLLMLV